MRTARCLIALTLILCVACAKEATPSAAVPAGDPVAGKAAFLELRCWSCHEISGGDMPKPVATPPMPVYLGGNEIPPPPDLELMRSIVNPSHKLTEGWGDEGTRTGTQSRMGDYSQAMTARELFDLIAFLKSRYRQPKG